VSNWIARQRIVALLLPALFFASACARSESGCPPATGAVLQVLGSGGPIADDGRASSSYLVWVDGVARVLIDAGGGSFLRFGESGADFVDLDFVGLSHFHTDHSADFPALLKSGSFSGRDRPLHVAGPETDGPFPGLKAWLRSMLDADSGAYGYLSGFLDGTAGRPMLVAKEIAGDEPVTVFKNAEIVVEAMRVPHGIVPALAFKVGAGGDAFVFASDQNGSHPKFAEFARDASILVMHLVVPEDVSGVGRRLHAPPSVVGGLADRAGAKKLVLSHFMARSLNELDKNVDLVRSGYKGEIILAEDLACMPP
jgi:ribonuclease BN (tRNA processing enzyme)